ncbi:MAG: lytic transglycosylase domain-containing protein [Parvibaculaceae bacterium]
MSKKAVILAMAFMLGLPGVARAENALEVKAAIAGYAAIYGLPEELVHRIVKRESKYNPKAYNRGHYGLMQIRYDTARSMGYRGKPKGLLDVDANLKYGVKYLAGAYLVSGGNADKAARYYRSGYYYVAKRKGLLEETGLKRKR